jgi:hypothetical protein
VPSDWESLKKAQGRYKRTIRCFKQDCWRTFCQHVNDILSVGRLHKIFTKDPQVTFGPLLLPSGECMSSGEEALKLMLETHFHGSQVLNE